MLIALVTLVGCIAIAACLMLSESHVTDASEDWVLIGSLAAGSLAAIAIVPGDRRFGADSGDWLGFWVAVASIVCFVAGILLTVATHAL